MNHSQVIVALDFDSKEQALDIVDCLGNEAQYYKVGLELLTSVGPDVVSELVSRGKSVFLDLKLHEIPVSVTAAVTAAGRLGVSMVSVHASAGAAVLNAAVHAASAFPNLKVLALTVITNLKDNDLPEIGLAPSVTEQVLRLSKLALSCGCHGLIVSAAEARLVSAIAGPDALVVTPGINLTDAMHSSGSRVATPKIAAEAGATHVVIGRAITGAIEPLEAYLVATKQLIQ